MDLEAKNLVAAMTVELRRIADALEAHPDIAAQRARTRRATVIPIETATATQLGPPPPAAAPRATVEVWDPAAPGGVRPATPEELRAMHERDFGELPAAVVEPLPTSPPT